MALELYKQKRNFKKTTEPTGGSPNNNKLRFVVQKHHACIGILHLAQQIRFVKAFENLAKKYNIKVIVEGAHGIKSQTITTDKKGIWKYKGKDYKMKDFKP